MQDGHLRCSGWRRGWAGVDRSEYGGDFLLVRNSRAGESILRLTEPSAVSNQAKPPIPPPATLILSADRKPSGAAQPEPRAHDRAPPARPSAAPIPPSSASLDGAQSAQRVLLMPRRALLGRPHLDVHWTSPVTSNRRPRSLRRWLCKPREIPTVQRLPFLHLWTSDGRPSRLRKPRSSSNATHVLHEAAAQIQAAQEGRSG